MKTFADKIIRFNKSLEYNGVLPEGISVMNPFSDEVVIKTTTEFYGKYYSDTNKRKFIVGINPGRHGAGVTGIPFTDTKRLIGECDISWEGSVTHEPSSEFIYTLINEFGGTKEFYSLFYINSICPLGFTKIQDNGNQINYNYYDSKELLEIFTPFMVDTFRKQLKFGIDNIECLCLGKDKNFRFLNKLNDKYGFFKKIIPIEHPRYIMQYQRKDIKEYIKKYLDALKAK
ncbi:MAG: DUF4918 family protein [Ignavibacteriaceae bacterium]|nr:DUF4918 family protein [Ignavibacteriaceae bacterium]